MSLVHIIRKLRNQEKAGASDKVKKPFFGKKDKTAEA